MAIYFTYTTIGYPSPAFGQGSGCTQPIAMAMVMAMAAPTMAMGRARHKCLPAAGQIIRRNLSILLNKDKWIYEPCGRAMAMPPVREAIAMVRPEGRAIGIASLTGDTLAILMK